MKKEISVLIKFNDDNIENYSAIEEHLKILENKGKVIWGQSRKYSKKNSWSGFNKEVISRIEKQEVTNIFLYESGINRLYIANLINHYNKDGYKNYKSRIKKPINAQKKIREYIPKYYKHQLEFDNPGKLKDDYRCYLYLEFDSIKEIDVDFIENITLDKYKENEIVPISEIKNQSSVFYTKLINSDIVPEFINEKNEKLYSETIEESEVIYEGIKEKIAINKYERNSNARKECIDYYGYNCKVCGMNFEEEYGEVGKDFIHVHHIIPLSEIGESYEVNPIEDLIPVCPNCHAMIHRGMDYTIK